MYPGYRFVDTFPHQRTQMPPYTHGYYPSFEATPPEMKMDGCRPPSAYEAWPHGGTFSHPTPVGCHGCCNHSYMPPGYTGFRPPYPHYMQPAPFHGYGGYPVYPETYQMHYMAPPHYSMSQPRYEYDKPKDHHCCGCANHHCNRKEDRQVRIEEQEPDAEKRLVPVDFHKDNPYPVMFIPLGYLKDGVNKKPSEPESKRHYENKKPLEQKPNNSQGVWFPFDIKNLGGHGMDGQDPKKSEKEKTVVDKDQFPFPIFWMPYKSGEEEGNEKTEALSGSESTKTSPTPTSGSNMQSKYAEEGSSKDGSSKPVEDKVVKLKTIPVKQLKEDQEEKMKEMDKAAKSTKQSSEKKPSRESSPPKTSKLPPVCLRLEPLKRKSRSVGSRSPSPPGDKEKSSRGKEMEKHDVRPSISIMEKTPEVLRDEGNGPVLEKKKSPETIKSDDGSNEAGKMIPKPVEDQPLSKEASTAAIADAAKESVEAVKKRNMSEEEAVLIIQAAFRGFEVRKWEPLKKLKQIAMVKEQVFEVKRRVEAFESSPDVSIDSKQKLLIGETIMSLILKLDTIQGLHPMVRDIRKSVAKELVSLQEKLDSLATEKPDAPIANPDAGLSEDDKDSTPIQEEIEAEAAQSNIEDGKSSLQAEPLQGQELHSSPNVDEIKPCNDFEGETSASPLGQGEEIQAVREEDGMQQDEALNLAVDESQSKVKIESCEGEVVQEEENLPQKDVVTEITDVAAEDTSKPEDEVTVKDNELFDLPSTEEQNDEASGGASHMNEVRDHETSTPEEDRGCDGVLPRPEGALVGLALEEDGTHVEAPPQLVEFNTELAPEVPQTVVTLEENGTMAAAEESSSIGDASQLEETNNVKDETFQDKEVLIEEAEESDVGGENVQSAAGEENEVQPLQEPSKLETAEEKALEKTESDQMLLEENQRLKKMINELIEAGKDQLSAITDLSGKVKHLEKKLARKKKVKTRRAKSAKERIEDIVV